MSDRPNIVFMICHDLGQHCGCYGAGNSTPNIDRLAEDGVLFSDYHCTAAQCSPSRGSIFTGKYPHNNGLVGLVNLGWQYGPGQTTMQMLLQEAGYSTHLIGIQHEARDPYEIGYQEVVSEHNRAEEGARDASQWLHERAGSGNDQPFFLSIGTIEPHRPFERQGYPSDDPDNVTIQPWLPDRPGIRKDTADLNGIVSVLDDGVGVVREALEDSGLAENTLFVFTTDHGTAMPRAKCTCYDPGTKTTLVMRMPGHWDDGEVHDELLTNCDMLPTIMEIAGGPPPEAIDGRSFLGLLDGGRYEPRDHIFTEMTYHGLYNPMRAIRTKRYKYIHNFDDELPLVHMPTDVLEWPGGAEMIDDYYSEYRPVEELYDLQEDPLEKNNIIDDEEYSDIAAELRERVDRWMEESGDPMRDGRYPSCPDHTKMMREFHNSDRSAPFRHLTTPGQKWFLVEE
ncbi:MAG: sulfatase [Armatimonadota bacterium]